MKQSLPDCLSSLHLPKCVLEDLPKLPLSILDTVHHQILQGLKVLAAKRVVKAIHHASHYFLQSEAALVAIFRHYGTCHRFCFKKQKLKI